MRYSKQMDFVALDVETANPDIASICQIGLVRFANGSVVESWSSLVNPEDEFDAYNVAVHGITESMVQSAPTWEALHTEIANVCKDQVVVSHTPFDRTAILRASNRYQLPDVESRWLDSARVVRRTWPQFAKSGYGLRSIASFLSIDFNHHDAEEDARAAGEVLVKAIIESETSVEDWCVKSTHSMSNASNYTSVEPNPDGPLFGEIVVFTGTLSIPRKEAAQMAAAIGCEVGGGVTKKTTLLVVGDQDIRALVGHDKSSKHRKAEGLIEKGQDIRILTESDFSNLVEV